MLLPLAAAHLILASRWYSLAPGMDTFTIVRTEHLNHYGYLFGGQLLQWVDEFAWLVASRDFAGCLLVTRAMEKADFKTRVENGSILRFHIHLFHLGTTSVTYGVEVFADEPGASIEKTVFSNRVTFACVDHEGSKCALPKLIHFRSEEKYDDEKG